MKTNIFYVYCFCRKDIYLILSYQAHAHLDVMENFKMARSGSNQVLTSKIWDNFRTTGPLSRSQGGVDTCRGVGWGHGWRHQKIKIVGFCENWREVRIRYREYREYLWQVGTLLKTVAKDNTRGKLLMDFAKNRYGY